MPLHFTLAEEGQLCETAGYITRVMIGRATCSNFEYTLLAQTQQVPVEAIASTVQFEAAPLFPDKYKMRDET